MRYEQEVKAGTLALTAYGMVLKGRDSPDIESSSRKNPVKERIKLDCIF
jgi:hypothetical protein